MATITRCGSWRKDITALWRMLLLILLVLAHLLPITHSALLHTHWPIFDFPAARQQATLETAVWGCVTGEDTSGNHRFAIKVAKWERPFLVPQLFCVRRMMQQYCSSELRSFKFSFYKIMFVCLEKILQDPWASAHDPTLNPPELGPLSREKAA